MENRITKLLDEVERASNKPALPISEMDIAFKINPKYMIEEYGIDNTIRFLSEHKQKTAQYIIEYITKALTKLGGDLDLYRSPRIEINFTECFNTNTTVNQSVPAPTDPIRKTKRLVFRLVQDARLSLNDRIIFSLAWKYAYYNTKKKDQVYKIVHIETYHKFTGLRHDTIKACLLKLKESGYLSHDNKPLITKSGKKYSLTNGMAYLGHRKLSWLYEKNEAADIRARVAVGVIATNILDRQNTTAWTKTALGISRMTAYRYLKAGITNSTVDTVHSTDDTE